MKFDEWHSFFLFSLLFDLSLYTEHSFERPKLYLSRNFTLSILFCGNVLGPKKGVKKVDKKYIIFNQTRTRIGTRTLRR